jgi:serine/threonine protein kinase
MDEKLKEQLHTIQGEDSYRLCPTCGLKLSWSTKSCPVDGTATGERPKPGTVFKGHYEFQDVIGEGGMSIVYKARDKMLGRTVAIKLMHTHIASSSRQIMRFQQEAKAASLLSHPNVISIHEFGMIEDGQPFLIMDYADGKSLSEIISTRGRLPLTRALGIFVQVCDALSHAHHKNVIHRDLKPSNIMLCRGDRGEDVAKVVDFGIAKIVQPEADKRALTQTGEVFGSPPYMSPEQCAGWPLNNRSDIYSMGCLMFEALSGSPPFQGESLVVTVYKHMNEPPPRLVLPGEKYPDVLEKIILKCLDKDPNERYHGMEQLRDDLQRVLDEIEGREHDGAFYCTDEERSASYPAFHWLRTHPIVAGTIGLLVLASAAATLSMNMGPSHGSKVPSQEAANVAARDSMLPISMPNWSGDDATMQDKINNHPEDTLISFDDKPLSDAGFVNARRLRWLKRLSIADAEITDKTLKELGMLPVLERLNIKKTPVTDDGMAYLTNLKNLNELNLADTRVTGKGIPTIARIKSLVSLDLGNLNLTDEDLAPLAQLPNLKILKLNGNHVSGKALANFKELRGLELHGNPVSDETVDHLLKVNKLAEIDLGDTAITDSGGVKLAAHRSFTEILLQDTKVGDGTTRALLKLPNLVAINLSGTKITSKVIPAIAASRTIQRLDLNKTAMDNRAVGLIGKMTQLTRLDIGGSPVDDAGFAQLAGLKSLIQLGLDHTRVGDQSMPTVVKFSNLKELNLSGTHVTNKGVEKLAQLDHISYLQTANCRRVDDEGLSVMRRAHPQCRLDTDVLF